MRFDGWESRVLGALGVAATPPRVAFLAAWAACEGGGARFNPLNTTLRVHGSTPFNSAGVQHYQDATEGVAATLLTLRLSFYADIRAALAVHGLSAHQIALRSERGLDKWGTGHECILRRVGAAAR